MKIHPRHKKTTIAFIEADQWLNEWEHKHQLTSAEVVAFIAGRLASLAKYAIRDERDSTSGGDIQ